MSDSSLNKKKILICGGTGFIGTNLVNHFSNNDEYEVHAIYNQRRPPHADGCIWHRCDLTNAINARQLLSEVRPDFIVQVSITTSGMNDIVHTPALHVTDNAVMNSYLFRLAVEHEVSHLIFFSCTVMYQSSDTPTKEHDLDENEVIHEKYFGAGHTKLYLEKMCEFYSRLGKQNSLPFVTQTSMGRMTNLMKKEPLFWCELGQGNAQDRHCKCLGHGQRKKRLVM